jgi:signal transduction histidine kinase
MRVLVVTADASIADALEQVAEERGHSVARYGMPAAGAREATEVDLAFISWDGSAAARDLYRAIAGSKRAVVAAVLARSADIDAAADAGASLAVVAPVDAGEAARAIAIAERAVGRLAGESTGRRQMEPQLQLADRMAAIGTLAGGVGHEINNPLTYIIGNLGLLGDLGERANWRDLEWSQEFREVLNEIAEGVGRIRQVVRDLKMFESPERERPQLVDVRRIVDSMVSMARNEIRHRAAIERSDDDEIPAVSGNQARIGQVVLNLLINAAQALPVGDAANNRIAISVTHDRTAGRVVITVSDTGPGIPLGLQGRIFDPFFSTKEVGTGTGLGLAMCHGIVAAMGGEITVESREGRGATFRVALPTAAAAATSNQAALDPTEQPRSTARILIVDDEPAIVAMVQRALEGYDVLNADSGREALERMLGSEEFDLILCDLMMPIVTGMDVFREVEKRAPHLVRRIAFITAGAFSSSAQEFLRTVNPPCLEKPFTLAELRSFVDGLLA